MMISKHSGLLCQEDKKQKILTDIGVAAERERRQKHFRPGDFIVYSPVVWNLAKDCWNCGCSYTEISQAARVTHVTASNWVRKTTALQVRELNIVPDKVIDTQPSMNLKSEVAEKCEFVFPSGVKLVMDAKIFTNNIMEILFTQKG